MTARMTAIVTAACLLALGCSRAPGVEMPEAPPRRVAETPPEAKPDGPPVTLTPKAVEAVRKVVAGQGGRPHYLRLRVIPGGCTGCSHKLDLDPDTSADDMVFRSAGVRVVIAAKQLPFLRGTSIDYRDSPTEQGFKVENPNFQGEALRRSLDALEREKAAE